MKLSLQDVEQIFFKLELATECEFPTSFNSIMHQKRASKACAALQGIFMSCACGAFLHHVCSETVQAIACRCYCIHCRWYHASSFAALLTIAGAEASAVHTALQQSSFVRTWRGRCNQFGCVDRYFCNSCGGRLATCCTTQSNSLHVALGAIRDESIQSSCAKRWQSSYRAWCLDEASPMYTVLPRRALIQNSMAALDFKWISGGCCCSGCIFDAQVLPGELQHCYCNLCRKFSGSAMQSWIPSERFKWVSAKTLVFRRTTQHGRRHMCSTCGTALTIVYDSDPDTVWPAVGTLHDSRSPENNDVDSYLARVIHICCEWMAPWYRLPDDGLPRLRYAGCPD